ncbi:hypothetical protein Pmi06nite_77030 [Planotetraspora mira]|uniref:Uncharacterized protein n=1 Tax=Planotetraspora mira TaxID=58121 RepID=A0A8J3TYJ4_9ACTN|nr:hypothetical protein Pmi06nite_77030 [Planotetraspora mira]
MPPEHARNAQWGSRGTSVRSQDAETGDGVLRHPSWRGLRSDEDPGDLVRIRVAAGLEDFE